MCLKSNRKKSGRRSLTKKGRVFALERRGKRKLNGEDASPPSDSIRCKSIEHLALGEEKGRTPLTSPLLGTQSQLMINDRHFFGKGKVKDFSPQVNLFPCIIIPINKLFYSYSTTDISV